jgi:hypothetical protein
MSEDSGLYEKEEMDLKCNQMCQTDWNFTFCCVQVLSIIAPTRLACMNINRSRETFELYRRNVRRDMPISYLQLLVNGGAVSAEQPIRIQNQSQLLNADFLWL